MEKRARKKKKTQGVGGCHHEARITPSLTQKNPGERLKGKKKEEKRDHEEAETSL